MRIGMRHRGDRVIDDDRHSGLRFRTNRQQTLQIHAAQQRIARRLAEQTGQRLVFQQRTQILILALADHRQKVRAAAKALLQLQHIHIRKVQLRRLPARKQRHQHAVHCVVRRHAAGEEKHVLRLLPRQRGDARADRLIRFVALFFRHGRLPGLQCVTGLPCAHALTAEAPKAPRLGIRLRRKNGHTQLRSRPRQRAARLDEIHASLRMHQPGENQALFALTGKVAFGGQK